MGKSKGPWGKMGSLEGVCGLQKGPFERTGPLPSRTTSGTGILLMALLSPLVAAPVKLLPPHPPSQSGHRVTSMPVIRKRDSCHVSEGAGSGFLTPRSMRQASRHSFRCLLLKNPKWRIFTNPSGGRGEGTS